MLKNEIIYNGLLHLISNFSINSENFEPYYESLNDSEQGELITVAEKLEQEYQKLEKHKQNSTLYPIDADLTEALEIIKNRFEGFPDNRVDEIRFQLKLLLLINDYITLDFNLQDEVNIQIFELIATPNKVQEPAFIFCDSNQLENSILLFSLDKMDDFYSLAETSSPSLDLLLCLMSKIGQPDRPLNENQYILISSNISSNKSKAWAYTALHLVKKGKIAHVPYPYHRVPSVSASKSLQVTENYHQFKDVLTILSEYNSQEDILDKFLRLYHVIENFMFKYPIVTLEHNHNGNPFSFRDFQRIYTAINRSEIQTLQKLCKKVFERDFGSTANMSFKKYIYDELKNIVETTGVITILHFNLLLGHLRVQKKEDQQLEYADIDENSISKHYSSIVYGIRNSLVHNKETEFHLTHEVLLGHADMGDTVKILIDKFLLPTMEEIVFNLLTDKGNDLVWFKNSTLMLWHDA